MINNSKLLAFLLGLVSAGTIYWQDSAIGLAEDLLIDPSVAREEPATSLLWFDARDIGVEGLGWSDTQAPYDRLPARAEGAVRPAVWSLAKQSAGICVRFKSDSPSVHVRWELTSSSLAMPHMPATGVSGVDLYVKHNDTWKWLANGRPEGITNSALLCSGLAKEVREYLAYFPLYNGVSKFEVGIAQDSRMWLSKLHETKKPMVFWGTSITQGGCASRPGMVHTAILGRRFEYPIINLGFSGNGKLESEMAQLIAEIDASIFVLDCLPNLNAEEIAARIEPVVQILRAAHPQVPILLVEDRTYASAFLNDSLLQRNESNRQSLAAAFTSMQSKGIEGLFYLPGGTLLGQDGEDTVDGSHPTDLGFVRQADAFEQAFIAIGFSLRVPHK